MNRFTSAMRSSWSSTSRKSLTEMSMTPAVRRACVIESAVARDSRLSELTRPPGTTSMRTTVFT